MLKRWILAAALAVGGGAVVGVAEEEKEKDAEAHSPLPPQEAADKMKLPPGFKATVFAAEDDVLQPIGFCIDERGRLWVAECYSYPEWAEKGKDRILILEDTDGDGVQDKRTVFAEGFGYLTGVQVGMGGVWVANAPHLLFYPDRNRDDVPDGEPEIHLEGWNWKGVHNVINCLTWGPDGWLYGANGITVDSDVKVAGAPESERVKLNCAIWRYHPTRKKFEVWSAGTTNPWGIDFDENGQMFFSSSVTPHVYHGIQGSHFQRMHGKDFNPYIFELMKTCADHLHWGGGDWTTSRGGTGVHSVAGGGHAHAGAMIYYGDSFPEQYRGTIFFNNIHGRRINNDRLERKGSGFVATHAPDFMQSPDPWYRAITLQYGPDGGVYSIDWNDTDECHDHEAERETGRIYKISYELNEARRRENPAKVDLAKLSDMELFELQKHTNEWFVRHARRMLRDRVLSAEVRGALTKMLNESATPVHRLRALWTLHQMGGTTEAMLLEQLLSPHEFVRGWAIQLLCEDKTPSDRALARFADLAKDDPSPAVRLYLAAALQRIPLEERWPIVEPLLSHAEDAADQNLPLMYWYATEPLVKADTKRAMALTGKTKVAKVREFITRRLASK
jgi:putative membrane-bound dehydrogenase-like protein